MHYTAIGQLRPQVTAAPDADTLAKIMAVCPGAVLGGPLAMLPDETAKPHDPIWGPVAAIHRSWSGDSAIRQWAAAGGTLTALGCHLLRSGEVEAILHVKASAADPLHTEAQVSRSPEEVIAAAQSRYGPGAALTRVAELLDTGTVFAVIAKPCDIAAIRHLQQVDARARAQIRYCLTIFCGGVPSTIFPEVVARHVGFRREELSLFRWRGNGWPGPTHLETTDGRVADLTYDQLYYTPDVPWTYDMQFRCKICADAIGSVADIAAPDGWVMRDGQPVHDEAPGVNIAIARTEKGAALLRSAAGSGALVLEDFSVEELYAMHGDHLDRRLGAPARLLGLRAAGQPVMRLVGFEIGPMLRMAARRFGWRAVLRDLWAAFIGARRRAKAGAHREPLT
ncbi:Coenzyme F420 hydrogenase/dehydrogenase, beta subunit C-terminal domain [Dongia mobilis]|nr:Coenzyme F420 hydrogenase/dehydrogenase, beta subunit C-terminal domain [Dongia mobilis]